MFDAARVKNSLHGIPLYHHSMCQLQSFEKGEKNNSTISRLHFFSKKGRNGPPEKQC